MRLYRYLNRFLEEGVMDNEYFEFSSTEGKSLFLEGQLGGHVYSLADNHGVLVDARADVCDYLKDWCNGAAAFFRERTIDDFSPHYREVLVALDLRVLILPQAESVAKEQLSALVV
jgi:hypothetical protein